MQNINQRHHGTPEWEKKYHDGLTLLQFSVDICWDQISRGKFFLHEHPATASSWDLPMIRELAEHPGVTIVTGDMCRCGGHEHSKLEGSKRKVQASKYPTSLVQGILNVVRKLKIRLVDANHSRDPVHFMIPEGLRQTEDEISLVCNRKQMSTFDMNPPLQNFSGSDPCSTND